MRERVEHDQDARSSQKVTCDGSVQGGQCQRFFIWRLSHDNDPSIVSAVVALGLDMPMR